MLVGGDHVGPPLVRNLPVVVAVWVVLGVEGLAKGELVLATEHTKELDEGALGEDTAGSDEDAVLADQTWEGGAGEGERRTRLRRSRRRKGEGREEGRGTWGFQSANFEPTSDHLVEFFRLLNEANKVWEELG